MGEDGIVIDAFKDTGVSIPLPSDVVWDRCVHCGEPIAAGEVRTLWPLAGVAMHQGCSPIWRDVTLCRWATGEPDMTAYIPPPCGECLGCQPRLEASGWSGDTDA